MASVKIGKRSLRAAVVCLLLLGLFALILLGVSGVLAPATSALMHNTSTLLISLKSMTNLLDHDKMDLEMAES